MEYPIEENNNDDEINIENESLEDNFSFYEYFSSIQRNIFPKIINKANNTNSAD